MSHQQVLQHLSNMYQQPPNVIESIVLMLILCTIHSQLTFEHPLFLIKQNYCYNKRLFKLATS